MAKRLLFSAKRDGDTIIVTRKEIEFEWVGGFAKVQKLKRLNKFIEKLPEDIRQRHLEISSGSNTEDGKNLSAFNLSYSSPALKGCKVESVYQGSKIFVTGGPFQELYNLPSIVAKKDSRVVNGGRLLGFQLFDEAWPLEPTTGFYNYLYFLSLVENPDIAKAANTYEYFSDLEFNHEKAVSCQAESLAVFFTLYRENYVGEILQDKVKFLHMISRIQYVNESKEESLFESLR